jgi:hypothetical protein
MLNRFEHRIQEKKFAFRNDGRSRCQLEADVESDIQSTSIIGRSEHTRHPVSEKDTMPNTIDLAARSVVYI